MKRATERDGRPKRRKIKKNHTDNIRQTTFVGDKLALLFGKIDGTGNSDRTTDDTERYNIDQTLFE